MLGVTPFLKLGLFAASEDGWAAGMNANLQKIDAELTSSINKMTDRARAVENAVALRMVEFVQAVDANSKLYVTKLEAVKTAALAEIKAYIDNILAAPIARAEENQIAILNGIQNERSRLDELESKIERAFVDAQSYVDSLFNELSNQVSSNIVNIVNMRDSLQGLLNQLAAEINSHIKDYNNPHQVTFEQSGGQNALIYVKDPSRDAAYSP